jgi:membrane peptidoglycan carboxypeptidase
MGVYPEFPSTNVIWQGKLCQNKIRKDRAGSEMSDSSRRKPTLVAENRYPKSAKRPAPKKPAAKKAAPPKRKPAPRKPAKPRRKATPKRGGGGNGTIRGFIFGIWRWFWRLVWGLTWRLGMTVALLVGLAVGYQYLSLPEYTELLDGRARGSVTLLDRNGDVFAWRGDQFGGVVTAKTVSPDLKNAVVATEDKRFYRHFGISPRGVASAVRINLSEGRGPLSGHGGSTITQQTAKLLCLGVEYDPREWKSEAAYVKDCRRGSLWRKVKEAIYAMAMEVKYSKDEILSVYLNRAYMGAGAYGAEAAMQRYFGKPAAAATPAEGAMLAGLLTAPSTLAPTANLQRSQDRAATVLRLMNEQGYLSDTDTRKWQDHPAQLSPAAEARAGGYFADWVMSSVPDYFSSKTTEDVIFQTTLDQRLQKAAEDAMSYIFTEKVRSGSKAQAAIVVMSADGAVRAMVGGRETRVTGAFNRASQALRQTGSAFKPFVYATALELGYSPLDTIIDAPYCQTIPGSGEWCPKNYTHKNYGEVALTRALRDSLNVPAVKLSERVGRDKVRFVASQFGIESDLAAGPALALGASESTLIEMTGAYAGILNGGSAVAPYGVVELRLAEDDAPLMGTGGGIQERVIREGAARQLIWMMEKVVSEGTGKRAAIPGWQAAGKTGTTQAARDAWFVGFTSQYVAGVWMGYDDNTPLTGVTGSGLPAEIWHETMVRVHTGLQPSPLPMQEPIARTDNSETKPNSTKSQSGQGGNGLGNAVDQILKDIFGGGGRAPSGSDR